MREFSGITFQIRKSDDVWQNGIDGIYKTLIQVFVACSFNCFTVFHDAEVKCLW